MAEITRNPWTRLRDYTRARIALGRAGNALPTRANLQFQWDHARARDAVHLPLDFTALAGQLKELGLPLELLSSEAGDRRTYLQRPDLGRRLPEAQWQRLRAIARNNEVFDIAIIIADGLSSAAVAAHTAPFLRQLMPGLYGAGLRLAPLCLAEQGRVVLGDDIGEALRARLAVVLIGERPGLSSPDSLGLYLTFAPRRGRVDAERNCISNIRPEGLDYAQAAATCLYLVNGALRKGLSGVQLKDESAVLEQGGPVGIPFLR